MGEPQTPYAAVVDFEATCGNGIPGDQMEIIEFAVILARTCDWQTLPEGEFTRFVRPLRFPLLTRFCVELTTIPQRDVDWAPPFVTVLEEFRAWMANRVPVAEVTFCSWGDFDRRQLHRQCEEIDASFPFTGAHFNLRVIAARKLSLSRNEKQGLLAVSEKLGLGFSGTQHRGIDDCRNAIRIMKEIHSLLLYSHVNNTVR